jgi:D-glycero-D-manno-heptose 1,7-bisphosphate phosphatase
MGVGERCCYENCHLEFHIKGFVSTFKKAAFLDRDGVLNKIGYRGSTPIPPQTVEDFELYEDAPSSLSRLKDAGFLLVVVTNQPDVGRGLQSMQLVEKMHEILLEKLPIDRIEVCYSGDDADYRRKPNPGMLLDAAAALHIDISSSYMIGDRWRDIDAGLAAGCSVVYIDRGHAEGLRQLPHFSVSTLQLAVNTILNPASHDS